jgi:uncharacterized membrane protein
MSSLSTLGVVHTVISLVAVAAGIAAFLRNGGIGSLSGRGKLYIVSTALTCLSGFFIFAHGGFGKPHVLGVITLFVLALALLAERSLVFGRGASAAATVAYSLTFYFHLIPAVTETSTRLPAHAPLVASAESPVLGVVYGLLFLGFLFGVWRQLRRQGGHKGRRGLAQGANS